MQAPLYLAYRVLMSKQLPLTSTPNHRSDFLPSCGTSSSTLHHSNVPHFHLLVRTTRREYERAVFIPINTEGFSAWGTGRDGQNRGRDRLGERGIRLRGREERRCAKVENTNCSITRTRGNEVGLMGVKKCLIDTGLVSVESREGMRAFRRPL